MLTNKGKYGLKAMVYLAGMPEGQLVSVSTIAQEKSIPKKFLDAILNDLRNAGLVQSRKGPEGGYRLAKPAASIKLGQIVRLLDGPLAPVACASLTRYERCEDCDEQSCEVRKVMIEVRNAMAAILDTRSLAAICSGGSNDIPLVDYLVKIAV